jgi:hypothetical protein
VSGPIIWYLIKFFTEEHHADQFMAGELYFNTLGRLTGRNALV